MKWHVVYVYGRNHVLGQRKPIPTSTTAEKCELGYVEEHTLCSLSLSLGAHQ